MCSHTFASVCKYSMIYLISISIFEDKPGISAIQGEIERYIRTSSASTLLVCKMDLGSYQDSVELLEEKKSGIK